MENKNIKQGFIGAVPKQFEALIADKTEGFVGRGYVFEAIAQFIATNPNGYFSIIGDPGQGKSAILAKYVKDTGCITHFNSQLMGLNRTDQFLESVCHQLIDHYQLPYDSLPPNATRDGGFLARLLNEVAQISKGKPVIIAIDAIDEVDEVDAASYRDANILYLPPHLPTGVYFVMTRRRSVEMPFTTYTPLAFLDLSGYQDDNERDVREYIQNRIKESERLRNRIDNELEKLVEFISKLAEKSENNFMYLRYMLQDIENGLYQDLSLESFPQGVQGYYEFHWRRMGMTPKPLPERKIKIVYILAEVSQPVSRQQICDFSGEDALTVQRVLNEWEQFLHKEYKGNQIQYKVYHASFRDFLHRKDIGENTQITISAIHELIAKDQLNKWRYRRGN